jgi:hypothetical protein
MFRRRPLARAAVVGGAAYAVGRRSGQNRAEDEMMQQEYAAAQAEPAGLGADGAAELQRLAQLKDAGILTQAEFDMQKAKILAG